MTGTDSSVAMVSTARLGLRLVRSLRAHNALGAAASIAFWFFLSLIPLLLLIGYLVGQIARARGVDELIGPLLDVMPDSAEGLVRKELERMAGAKTASVAPLGVASFLWTASSGLTNLMVVLETVTHGRPRPWWKKRAIAVGWVALGLAIVCALAWCLVNAGSAMHASSGGHGHSGPSHHLHRQLMTPGEQAIDVFAALAVGTVLLAGFYRYAVQHPAQRRRRVWPGTITAVASWLLVSWVFGAYAVSIEDYAIYYGGLAAVAGLLLWLYLTKFCARRGRGSERAVGGNSRPPLNRPKPSGQPRLHAL